MRRAGHLFERVVDFHALCDAARRARRGKRISQPAADFLMHLEPEALKLQAELLDGSYHPQPYTTFRITDPKPRTISAAAFRDRVVHHSLCATLDPIFERLAIFDSYACRPGKGLHAAIERAQVFARRWPWALKLDVLHFFETASHAVLKDALARRIKDARVLALCDVFIDAGAPGSGAGRGMPIGNLTSQHFANFYLTALDRFIKQDLRIKGYLRYMDDMLLFADDKPTLWRAEAEIDAFARERLKLSLKHEARRLAPTHTGVPLLGVRIWPRLIRLDAARARRLRRRFRALEDRRRAGEITEAEAQRVSDSLLGWSQQADACAFLRSFFERLAPMK